MKNTRKKTKKPSSAPKSIGKGRENQKPKQLEGLQASPTFAPWAQVVGNAFVEQYYSILHQFSTLAHRFYKDSSFLSRPDSNGVMRTVTTMQAINEKILSLNYEDHTAEIETVDSQESYGGSVIVLVTGCLTGKDGVTRKFTQTFFLAPQEKGYYVLNDVFRYIEENKTSQLSSVSETINIENTEKAPVLEAEVIHAPEHVTDPVPYVEGELLHNGAELRDPLNYAEVPSGSKAQYSNGSENVKSDLPRKVLESLFDFHKSTEHNKDPMDLRNVVKKIQSLGSKFNVCQGVEESQQQTYAKGDDYYVSREDAKQHWDSMRSNYEKAAAEYAKKNRAYAACLSDQGRNQNKIAPKEYAESSLDTFIEVNKDIENVITIDLHRQLVKPAMKLLKLHLLLGSYLPSGLTLKVITGWGSHSVGKPKLKQSVIKLFEKEAIEWREENQGAVLIKLYGYREFNFQGSDSDDSDSN